MPVSASIPLRPVQTAPFRPPMRRITGEDYDIPAFAQQLNELLGSQARKDPHKGW